MDVCEGLAAVRNYANEHGAFPKAGANLADLGDFSVPDKVARLLAYGGDTALSLQSPERTIILRSKAVTVADDRDLQIYCGLVSGEVVILPAKDAVLGRICPTGVGRVVQGKQQLSPQCE